MAFAGWITMNTRDLDRLKITMAVVDGLLKQQLITRQNHCLVNQYQE